MNHASALRCLIQPKSVKKVQLITDGACLGNPGPGGWAAILRYGPSKKEVYGCESHTTNNRMELKAAIEGLRTLKEKCDVEVITDSEYVKNGVSAWLPGWKSNCWKTKAKKPVKNESLWRELDAAASRHRVKWRWVKGHAGHPANERCDELAVAEIAKIKKTLSADQLKAALEQFAKADTPAQTSGDLFS